MQKRKRKQKWKQKQKRNYQKAIRINLPFFSLSLNCSRKNISSKAKNIREIIQWQINKSIKLLTILPIKNMDTQIQPTGNNLPAEQQPVSPEIINQLVLKGDLSGLSVSQKLEYY